ncbi:hypothetical protein BGX29_009919 [Mortierella sp. GBA35]|nr:hypothetical protein BGX29_009919 [Mortierella sp. GBA35]
MSATTNYNYSLSFRVPPTPVGTLPAKRVFRSNPSSLSSSTTTTSSESRTIATAVSAATDANAQALQLSVNISTPPKSTTTSPWQWRLTLAEEKLQGEGVEAGGVGGSGDGGETEVGLSVALRGLSTASSLPSSGPFGGFLLQYKSFSLVAKRTRFTLVSKSIDSTSALSLQAKVKAQHVLDQDGFYNFAVVLSTESLLQETAMAPLGLVIPTLFLDYPKSIDAIFDDPVSTDVVFLWLNKVVVVDDNQGDEGDDSDDSDEGWGFRPYEGVTISRLYAHQAVLHQYPYFRKKLPLSISVSSPSSPSAQGGGCCTMPRKLLVRDFTLPLFRLVLRYIYTKTIDTTGIIAAAQTATTTPKDQQQKQRSAGGHVVKTEEPPITWMEVYQIADNLELDELRLLATDKMEQDRALKLKGLDDGRAAQE